jgi:SHS2 domain-containing protein
MFETFEHTADLGLRVRAPDLDQLFAQAAEALFCTIVEDPRQVRPVTPFDLKIRGEEKEYLLFDWLNELLFQFETNRMVFGRFEVHVDSSGITARAWGEVLDGSRHRLAHEVKAITYHGLTVQSSAEGWLAEFIVDI